MEGQDHDLLVRIDERVLQIHDRLGGYDERLEVIEKRTATLEQNQGKAMAVVSFVTFFIALAGKNILDLVIGLFKKT